ncbi:unnamed protein product [Rotaria magnacalcarata]|uniref:protein-serine/threonine phosphatase n=1 Tax=Rotaria magnacalcarata TaxID=392030 RepID=A0A8S2KQW9_9BILA|nr:unnamed protein product [Rotaria magnacalcarata]CAF3864804.1 unnamed protein product [Rotaria magnacalcarata]
MTTSFKSDLTQNVQSNTCSTSSTEKAEADLIKLQANQAFKDSDYEKAIELYTKAIHTHPDAILYSNRSVAYLRREWYGFALIDAKKALEYDPKYIKAYYRRASAYMALGKFTAALNIFFPAIEPEYGGPHLDMNGRVTQQFMSELLPYLETQKLLHKKYVYQIILQILSILKSLPTLVEITVPDKHKFTICGDVHGQFYDLLNIFKLNGLPSEENPYLFNGDFVDRGAFSVECIITLFGFKLLYPKHFFLARGNHESIIMNQMYGFEGEVKAKYTPEMFQLFTEVFNYLPLAHCINKKIFVIHGGLFSKDDITLQDICAIDRVRQPSDEGLMAELLWSDPQTQNGRCESKRGLGIQFGPDITERFLKLNNLEYIVRSHELKQQGYDLGHNRKCITVFSAPNYCDTMGNKGAFITITGDDITPKFTSYAAVPHPTARPMMYANQSSLFASM